MHRLHSRDCLLALLHRERARADRTGHCLAVVTFTLSPRAASRRSLLRVARAALTRTRLTDDVGWFDKNTLAVLLPQTDSAGAWCYAARILAYVERIATRPRVDVFTYPTDWSTLSKGTPTAAGGAAALPLEPLLVRPIPLGKRLLDIMLATVVLLLASPLLAGAFLAVKWTSPGPAIFRQCRAGLGGRPFTMYKFRSMYLDAEARLEQLRKSNEVDGPVFKMRNDPRVTPVGRILRRSSIDELPQLFNVLKGEMSMVGPRPPIMQETRHYKSWQYRRLDVTPGLTCIWQVCGRGRLEVSFDQWMRMDARYASCQSIWTDLRILLRTIPVVLFGRGAC